MRRLVLICAVGVVLLSAAGVCVARAGSDEEGFVSIFNGRDLTGWDGDPRLWSVSDGAIRGQTTEDKPARGNTFIIWRGGTLRDFILKVKFRIENGNSGIQYRSKEVGKWVISGYQAEVANPPGKPGFLYHEKGRAALVQVGDAAVIDENGDKQVVGKVADVEQLKAENFYKPGDWNEYTIIARGNHLMHFLNGYQTIELIDNDRLTDPEDAADRKGAAREGLLALQIHQGPPMVVEFKDIHVKHLKGDYGKAIRLFNGKDFEGWKSVPEGVKEAFSIAEGGVLACSGNPRGYMRTVGDYTNYVIRMQLKHVRGGNSGVLVRAIGPDKVWPRSIEAQGMSGTMGDIFNIDEFAMKTDPDRTSGRRTRTINPSNEKPLGQWNDYEVFINGGELRIYVNRLLQNRAWDCEEVAGKVALQSEGSAKEFRNVVLIPAGEQGD